MEKDLISAKFNILEIFFCFLNFVTNHAIYVNSLMNEQLTVIASRHVSFADDFNALNFHRLHITVQVNGCRLCIVELFLLEYFDCF